MPQLTGAQKKTLAARKVVSKEEKAFLTKNGYRPRGRAFAKYFGKGLDASVMKKGSGNWVYEIRQGTKRHSGSTSSVEMVVKYVAHDLKAAGFIESAQLKRIIKKRVRAKIREQRAAANAR